MLYSQCDPCGESYCCPCDRSCDWNHAYVGVEAGLNWLIAHSFDGYQQSTDLGYCVAGLFGYQFPFGLGLEGEIAYRNNNVDYVSFFGFNIPAEDPIWNLSYMANFFYELPYWCWKPFFGAGIGYSTQHAIVTDYDLPTDNNYDNFTYQAFIGLDYNIWRGLDIGIQYKFLHVLHSHLDNHGLLFSLKWIW